MAKPIAVQVDLADSHESTSISQDSRDVTLQRCSIRAKRHRREASHTSMVMARDGLILMSGKVAESGAATHNAVLNMNATLV